MAASQELITAASGRSLELVNVIRKTLEPFGLSRIEVDEALEGVLIRGQLPTRLGLLLHELATNASKYGALSNSKGRVAIGRGEAPAGRLTIEWREQGGPPVAPPQRRGFGTRLLQQALAPEGRVTFEFEPSGFRARVECSMVEA
jgi:two-component sensor histidine kinase